MMSLSDLEVSEWASWLNIGMSTSELLPSLDALDQAYAWDQHLLRIQCENAMKSIKQEESPLNVYDPIASIDYPPSQLEFVKSELEDSIRAKMESDSEFRLNSPGPPALEKIEKSTIKKRNFGQDQDDNSQSKKSKKLNFSVNKEGVFNVINRQIIPYKFKNGRYGQFYLDLAQYGASGTIQRVLPSKSFNYESNQGNSVRFVSKLQSINTPENCLLVDCIDPDSQTSQTQQGILTTAGLDVLLTQRKLKSLLKREKDMSRVFYSVVLPWIRGEIQ